MNSKSISILLILLVAVGMGIYVYWYDKPGVTDRVEVGNSETISKVIESGPSTIRKNSAPERLLLATHEAGSIFSDALDSELDHRVLEEFIARRAIGAFRIVNINSDLLRTRIRESADSPSFDMQLLDSDSLRLVAKGATEHSEGWQSGIGTWIGAVDGDETSRATFVVAPDGSVNGVIRTIQTGRIKIEPIKGTPHHLVWQLAPDFSKKID